MLNLALIGSEDNLVHLRETVIKQDIIPSQKVKQNKTKKASFYLITLQIILVDSISTKHSAFCK